MKQIRIPTETVIRKKLKNWGKNVAGVYEYRIRTTWLDTRWSTQSSDLETAVKKTVRHLGLLNNPTTQKEEEKREEVKTVKVDTISEILKKYEKLSGVCRMQKVAARSAIKTIVQESGLSLDGRVYRLTKKVGHAWFQTRAAAGGNDDELCLELKNRAISTLRNARFIFKKEMIQHYNLGESFDFHKLRVPTPIVKAYVRPNDGRFERAWARFKELKETEPVLYAAFLLVAGYGLRNSEGSRAKKDWFEPNHLVVRVSKTVRKGTEPRVLPIQDPADREFLLSLNPDGDYIFPGHKTFRCVKIWQRVNKILVECGFKDDQKTYLLRKEWGCQVQAQTRDILVTAKLMGNTPEVCRKHYLSTKVPEFTIKRGEAG